MAETGRVSEVSVETLEYGSVSRVSQVVVETLAEPRLTRISHVSVEVLQQGTIPGTYEAHRFFFAA
jgi:hypothetical protein